MINLHIAIQENLHEELLELVEHEGSNKTEIIRRALESYVREYRREARFRQMQAYAQKMAPHSREFVAESDAAVTEQVLNSTEW